MAFSSLLARPSAFMPVIMSVLAFAVVLVAVTFFGDAHQTDEGAAAHLWQLLVLGQLPIIAVFAVSWLPRNARSALPVLATQTFALLVAMAPVYLLHL